MTLKGLYAIVVAGALALGCEARRPEPPLQQPLAQLAPVVQQTVKPVRDDVISPLKEFLYAQYDIALSGRRDDLPELEKKLETSMKTAGLSDDTVALIKEGKSAEELEKFFAEQGLLLRRLRTLGQISQHNYELVRIGSTQRKEMTLFGVKKAYTKHRIVEELIVNSYNYEAQKRNSGITGMAGIHGRGTDTIDYRTYADDTVAQSYWEGEKAHAKDLDAEAADPSLLDKYIGRNKKLNQALCNRLGSLHHHLGCREQFNTLNEKAFKEYIKKMQEDQSEIHEVMHAIDSFDFNKALLDQLTKENRTRLSMEHVGHGELRSMLAEMYHGNAHEALGDVFKHVGTEGPGKVNEHHVAAKAIIGGFVGEIMMNRESYGNIDLTGFTPGKEALVCKQFGKLTPEQIRSLAKTVLANAYEGKTLKEFMERLAQQLLEQQKR